MSTEKRPLANGPSLPKSILQHIDREDSGHPRSNKGKNANSRTKLMIETLTKLKNNKTKKSGTQHQGGDAVERMKKFLSGLGNCQSGRTKYCGEQTSCNRGSVEEIFSKATKIENLYMLREWQRACEQSSQTEM